jgi:hypothetical protein
MVEINTKRLIMRGWWESDVAPWAAMNADPEVRQYFEHILAKLGASSRVQIASWLRTGQPPSA